VSVTLDIDNAVPCAYAYVADSDSGLQIIDISNPGNPALLTTLNIGGGPVKDVAVMYYYDYICAISSSYARNFTRNTFDDLGFYSAGTDSMRRIAVSGGYTYITGKVANRIMENSSGFPALVTYFSGTESQGVDVKGELVFTAAGNSGLMIENINDPSNPNSVGWYQTPYWAWDVVSDGNYIYVADITSMRIYQGYGPLGVESGQGVQMVPGVKGLKLKVAGNRIEYQLPTNSNVTIKIYNLLGQEVRTLVDGSRVSGSYVASWDGMDNSEHKVASGVYLVRLSSGTEIATAKMLVVK
jgi:hypothetical protein